MKWVRNVLLSTLVWLAIAGGAGAQGSRQSQVPQEWVECTGWHALCSASTDCKLKGDKADCDCLRVNETHIVETSAILDVAVRRLTNAKCTREHPCHVDQAPICKAIANGQYRVDNTKYDWVSTYSYRGWCGILQTKPKACDTRASGYAGDSLWAICDAAPCTEILNPSDPEKPLSCRCPTRRTPFVGANGKCVGDNGGIMSSMPMDAWDYRNDTYTFAMPGYEYVQGACAPLKSDPVKQPRHK